MIRFAARCAAVCLNIPARNRDRVINGEMWMGKRRGFFAELQHQARLAEQRQRQRERVAAQAHNRAVREHERAQREYLRVQAQYERARAAQARRDAAAVALEEKNRRRAYDDARRTEVELMNAELSSQADQIDSLLAATLEVDDFIDLAGLRQSVVSVPFERPDLTTPVPPPAALPFPQQPVYVAPEAPTGLAASFGGRKRHAQEVTAARHAFEQAQHVWRQQLAAREEAERRAQDEHRQREVDRERALRAAQEEHEAMFLERRRAALETNVKLERLMMALQDREAWAVEEFLGIVLSNSVYPECFPVTHDFGFDGGSHELRLRVTIPHPSDLPAEKTFRYVKSTDSIVASPLSQKARKDRYAKAVADVAIRSVHEVFESDRERLVQTISLTVDTEGVDPATGHVVAPVLVELAVDRASFDPLDLANVEASATLQHLRAGVSKNPHELVPVVNSRGVRG
ncbi:hypothetical protein [Tsukamurella sp. NPDC003166]|uniref:hypothetical protein n=1 Tax=Tsukamurella sp. NPDC003166 TaxID=3154444 RepID=UPI0033BA5CE7